MWTGGEWSLRQDGLQRKRHSSPLVKGTDKLERAGGSIQRSRNLREGRVEEEGLQLIGDEAASGMQCSESGKCQGLVCFRF